MRPLNTQPNLRRSGDRLGVCVRQPGAVTLPFRVLQRDRVIRLVVIVLEGGVSVRSAVTQATRSERFACTTFSGGQVAVHIIK